MKTSSVVTGNKSLIKTSECSLKRNWMKLVLDLNILLENHSDALHRKPKFQNRQYRIITELLKLKPFKIRVVNELQSHDLANSVNFCNWILLSALFMMAKSSVTWFYFPMGLVPLTHGR